MNQETRRRRQAGFSLIEMLIVVAIIGIISGLSYAGYQEVAKRGAAQNGAFEFVAALHDARSRAIERGHDVWFIIYTNHPVAAGSPGSYCKIEDTTGNFAAIYPTMTADTGMTNCKNFPGRLDWVDFSTYPGKALRFADPGLVVAKNPYTVNATALVDQRCTFCDNTGDYKGAVVFSPSGSVSFRAANGAVVATGYQSVGIGNRTNAGQQYKVVIARTGFIGVYSSRN